jgi:hypothetical protein
MWKKLKSSEQNKKNAVAKNLVDLINLVFDWWSLSIFAEPAVIDFIKRYLFPVTGNCFFEEVEGSTDHPKVGC